MRIEIATLVGFARNTVIRVRDSRDFAERLGMLASIRVLDSGGGENTGWGYISTKRISSGLLGYSTTRLIRHG